MVKIKSGDTLQGLCQARGLYYYSVKDTIMQLNGFTTESQLDRIRIGDIIALPTAAGSTAASSQEYMNASVSNASAINAGDAVSYFIVVYTVKYGDTLDSVYSSWNLLYNSYATMISRLNNGIDLNNLSVNQTLFLPIAKSVSNVPVSYTIYEHIVRDGETLTSICSERNIDLSQFGSTLQLFNPGLDFGLIHVGQKILYPATGAYTSSAASYTPAPSALPAAQPAAVQQQAPQNPLFENIDALYDGYGVVVSCGDYLCIRLETEGFDVYLTYTASVLNDYIPTPGDYVKCSFTPTDYLLASVNYVYNVFA